MGKGAEAGDDLQRREAEVTAREAALAERTEAAPAIVAAADERDARADDRDAAAIKREDDLDRADFLAPPDKPGYTSKWGERRNAALDRARSKNDRTASHDDREALTEGTAEQETDKS